MDSIGAGPHLGRDAQDNLRLALLCWRCVLGEGRVSEDATVFATDTSAFTASISAVLSPESVAQLQEIVKIADKFQVPLYPASTGKNWGYGTSVPRVSDSVIVDLSLMNRILDFDEELGVVTLEPGVTQADLHKFLQEKGSRFMVPVTGAGPSCSLVGNALERGFGITPITDHFNAVLSLKAVLPNGDIYQSAFRETNSRGSAYAHKWGIGPYLDGLFSQSGFGIVVDMSIALSPKPDCVGAFVFSVANTTELENLAPTLRKLINLTGSNVGGLNLMSCERIKATMKGSLRGSGPPVPGSGESPEWIDAIPKDSWTGFGSIYGGKTFYRATCKVIKHCLRGRVKQLRFINDNRLRWLGRADSLINLLPGRKNLYSLERLSAAYDIVQGIPSTIALNLAYSKSGKKVPNRPLNPALDGCGLLWYSPIVPMRTGVISQFVEFTERVCKQHGFEAPITLTSLSPRSFASTLPLLFDPKNKDEEDRAFKCYEELFSFGREYGFVPYRVGTQFMTNLIDTDLPFWRLASRLKEAIDPGMVLAPGRYSPDSSRRGSLAIFRA